MINTKLYGDFCFLKVNFTKYHYTDNKKGSPYHYFAYLEKGTAKIVSKDKTIYINEGDVFYIPKNTSYQSYWYGNDEISFFSYGCKSMLTYDTNFLDLQVIKCPFEIPRRLISIPTMGTKVGLREIGEFFTTAAELLPYMKKAPVSGANEALTNAKKYLDSDPFCSNSHLARECKISLPYLYKIFKNLENETPNSYRQKALCNKAKDILRTTDFSIEQISRRLCFSSSGYFRTVFKKHTGMTPTQYRKLYYF